MIKLLEYKNFYLMGIKGVAMTSLAQCLLDAEKNVFGCDVEEEFVTQDILDLNQIKIDIGFDHQLTDEIDCLVYTAAHQGENNPLVIQAKEKGIKCYSQAEALSELFNTQDGVAVCGVGGKSTVSAMLAWIVTQLEIESSFSVGVGNIGSMNRTGQWNDSAKYFIAEADEYVINPGADRPIPRFSFLKPMITICGNLKFDHPDVYRDFDHTKETFLNFFNQIKPGGSLIINHDDDQLLKLSQQVRDDIQVLTVGRSQQANLVIQDLIMINGVSEAKFSLADQDYSLKLKIPGDFNLFNGLLAILAGQQMGISVEDSIQSLASFPSTTRRFEYLGEKKTTKFYDDYAHHPNEVHQAIKAIKQWYPNKKIVVAFQPHTYSRTKKLFDQFVTSLAEAENLILLDIFSSAREKSDPTVSCQLLKQEIENTGHNKVQVFENYQQLADFVSSPNFEADVFLSIGAGDIYKFYQLVKND